jgi:hypothetical protein
MFSLPFFVCFFFSWNNKGLKRRKNILKSINLKPKLCFSFVQRVFRKYLRFCVRRGRKKILENPSFSVIFFNRIDPQISCFHIHVREFVEFPSTHKKGIVSFKTFSHCTANNLLSCFCFLFFSFFYTKQPLSTLSRRINLFLVPSYNSFFCVYTLLPLFLSRTSHPPPRLHPSSPLFLTFYVKI